MLVSTQSFVAPNGRNRGFSEKNCAFPTKSNFIIFFNVICYFEHKVCLFLFVTFFFQKKKLPIKTVITFTVLK